MEKQINIDSGAIENTESQLKQICTPRILSEGQKLSQGAVNAVQRSEGNYVKQLQNHIKQEQKMVESIGSGLMSIMLHIHTAASALTEQDHNHAASHDLK